MIVEVSCEECGHVLGYTPKSEFPDRPGAEAFVRRHRGISGHILTITERPRSPVPDHPCDRRGRRMTAPERPVSEQAGVLADELQAVAGRLPAYASRPNLTLEYGLKVARLVERLAKQVEAQQ